MTTPGHPGYVYGISSYTCVLPSGEQVVHEGLGLIR